MVPDTATSAVFAQLLRGALDAEEPRLHVARVLARLEEEVVGAALEQAERLLAERGA